MRILFAGRPIACVMSALEFFIVRILFAGWLIAREMGVLKVCIVDLLVYSIEWEFYLLAGSLHVKWVF